MIRSAHQLALTSLLLLAALFTPEVGAAREYLQLFVTEPYLELHTGPGRGYPVFHVVERDASIDVLFRRTDWFKVRTEQGVEGWASQKDMQKTVLADGTRFVFPLGDRAGFTSHNFEMGMFTGTYGGATEVSGYAAAYFNSQLGLEGTLGQYLGTYSNGFTADIGLIHVFAPEWRASPFVTLGLGLVRISPKATLVQAADRTEDTAYAGIGVRYYLTRRFFLRGEFKTHYIFTTRNANQEEDEWKLGFAFFF